MTASSESGFKKTATIHTHQLYTRITGLGESGLWHSTKEGRPKWAPVPE